MGCCFSSEQESGPVYSHSIPRGSSMREHAAGRPLQHYPSHASRSAHHRHSQVVHTLSRAPTTSTTAGHTRQPATLSRGNAVRRSQHSEHRKLSRRAPGSVSRSSAQQTLSGPSRYCRGRVPTQQVQYMNASISMWDPTPVTRGEGSKRRKPSVAWPTPSRNRSSSVASTVSRESAPDCTLNRMATTSRVRRTYGLPPRKREINVDERDVFGHEL